MALTSDNCLIRMNNLTGTVLDEIYLGPKEKHSFRHIKWETWPETILLQTKYSHEKDNDVLQGLALFSVYPLKFHGLIEVKKSVSYLKK